MTPSNEPSTSRRHFLKQTTGTLASTLELAPGLENITSLDSPAPVSPDAAGKYPIAMPGQTKAL